MFWDRASPLCRVQSYQTTSSPYTTVIPGNADCESAAQRRRNRTPTSMRLAFLSPSIVETPRHVREHPVHSFGTWTGCSAAGVRTRVQLLGRVDRLLEESPREACALTVCCTVLIKRPGGRRQRHVRDGAGNTVRLKQKEARRPGVWKNHQESLRSSIAYTVTIFHVTPYSCVTNRHAWHQLPV